MTTDPMAEWCNHLAQLVAALQATAFEAPRQDRARLLRAATAGNALIRALRDLTPPPEPAPLAQTEPAALAAGSSA